MKKLIFLLLIFIVTGCTFFKPSNSLELDTNIVEESFIKGQAVITNYTIYGRYFNIEGEIDLENDNISLVLKYNDLELEYPLILENSLGKTKFKTNKLINEGINLDKIGEGVYQIYLKENDNYYTLKNKTSYDNLSYYTTTKNNNNNHIEIYFDSDFQYTYFNLDCKKVNKKEMNEVYDIVIDPGHGGVDSGAIKNGYKESNINLDYGKKIKEELENYGLKVKLTRDNDTTISNYGVDGRVSVPYVTKAKLMLSIHMNSATSNVGSGGVEIYVPNKSNINFALNLAKNVVGFTSSNYSPNMSNKIGSGVYLRTLSQFDLNEIKKDADKKGYKPYEKATLESTYYYIIRETGGIITNAYVDSRNKDKEWNRYYSSNHGCETYLFELGYINSNNNLKILLNEKDSYIKAIVLSVLEYLEI